MSQNLLQMLANGTPSAPLYSDSVFSAYTYTGNGSTQTITTGIDTSTNGGMVWVKGRSNAGDNNYLTDTVRGATKTISSDSTGASLTDASMLTAFSSSGFSIGTSTGFNRNASTYVSWTFREAAKFFDIVTWTGDSVAGRVLSHSLGQTPGMIVVKRTDAGGYPWYTWHRNLTAGNYLKLNDTVAESGFSPILCGDGTSYIAPTSSVFNVAASAGLNMTGGTYVAYLFSHDTATDGLIQCGTFTTNGSGNATVTLGWEPQYVMVKPTGTAGDWRVIDTARGWSTADYQYLRANTSGVEANFGGGNGPNATGFVYGGIFSAAHIYLAIRRPNKPPTLGTQVYNAIARTGTGAAATVTGVGFAPDAVWSQVRNIVNNGCVIFDRLRGANNMERTSTAAAEYTGATNALTAFGMDGYTVGADSTLFSINYSASGETYANWCFKRAPGVFDEVCYTGTGSATTQAHSLGVAPELMISKNRSGTGTRWYVYHATLGATKFLGLNETSTPTTATAAWNDTAPTSSIFTVGSGDTGTTDTHVAYLFATKAGISKVGSYTGDGTSGQTIDCGFATGARFILIKRTDSTGDWFVWDSTRGIVAGNDPHISMNTTAAEVTTDDSVDTDNSGFIVNQVAATNVNVNTATYIFLAFA